MGRQLPGDKREAQVGRAVPCAAKRKKMNIDATDLYGIECDSS